MKIFFAFMVLLLTISVQAQTIKTIKYDGMVHMSKSVALRMLDFKVGDEVSEEKIDESIKKYFSQGYFDDIWVDIQDGNLIFHFKEKPIISQIELKGWKENDAEIRDSVLQIKKGSLYNQKKLEAAKRRIIDAISQDGKIDTAVEIEKEYLKNGSMKVTFVVNEGEKIIIENLVYSGALKFDTDLFNEVIANKQKEFMGWLWGRNDGKMHLKDIEYDPLRIRDIYMQYGYLDAKIDKPFTIVNFDHYTADMSYQIAEGEIYYISGVTINQIKKVIDDKAIKEVVTLVNGKAFNIKTFRENADKIKTMIADLGYAFVEVVPDLKKDKKKHMVEVVFKIMPGEKVRIRNVIISGNSRTLDRIIRRELYLGPGDMYSLTDLKDSRNSLGRLGFFDSNTIEEKRIDNKTMDLIVKVKEAPTGNIQLGGGYGSYGGLLVSIGVDDRNIWGSGINMGVKIERSESTENYSYNISNPRLNDSDFSGNFSIYKSMYEYDDYTIDSDGIAFGFGHRFSRHISGYLGYGFSTNQYSDINETTRSDYDYDFENYSKSSLTASLSYDDTDDYYLPREGMTISQSLECAGLGGDAKFLKARTTFAKYYGLKDLIGFDVISRYKARYYYVEEFGYLPIAEKFYMGGLKSVRGYESHSLSPKRINADGSETRIGAKQTFSTNIELSFPLIPKAKMRLVTFADWGFIGDKLTDISRGSYGMGMEWFSPVGPVQLIFAKSLNEQQGDETSTFEFTMGQRF